MISRPRHPSTLLVLLLTWSAWAACAPRQTEPARLVVAVSVPPQAWLVSALAGSRVRTVVMVPPGSAPATYEPTPRQRVELEAARIYLAVGHRSFPFEVLHLWPLLREHGGIQVVTMTAAEASAALPASMEGPAAAAVEASEAGAAAASAGAAAERAGGTAESAGDPHLWLSPTAMRVAARRLATALAAVDPPFAADYRRRLQTVEATIDSVDQAIQQLLAPVRGRSFLVMHPAWTAFARHFGLRQRAIEEEGKEPAAAHLAALMGWAKQEGVDVVFYQKGFSSRMADVLAHELGAELVELDPLAPDWPAMMLQTARALREALAP